MVSEEIELNHALAAAGTRFEYAYATPLCGPSRCEILTGRYPFRTGLINNNSHNAVQPGREIMLPTIMQAAGYATALHGKWHLGSHDGRLPNDKGSDEWYGIPRRTLIRRGIGDQ